MTRVDGAPPFAVLPSPSSSDSSLHLPLRCRLLLIPTLVLWTRTPLVLAPRVSATVSHHATNFVGGGEYPEPVAHCLLPQTLATGSSATRRFVPSPDSSRVCREFDLSLTTCIQHSSSSLRTELWSSSAATFPTLCTLDHYCDSRTLYHFCTTQLVVHSCLPLGLLVPLFLSLCVSACISCVKFLLRKPRTRLLKTDLRNIRLISRLSSRRLKFAEQNIPVKHQCR